MHFARALVPFPRVFVVYTDESSQTQRQYMVLGGALIREESVGALDKLFVQVRERHNIWGEFKWSKCSRKKLDAYKDFVGLLITGAKQNKLHFHSLIVDTYKINNHLYNQGDRDLGFSKFIYQLLIKFGRLYSGAGHLNVRMDNRTTSQDLEELRTILNNGIRKRWQVSTRPYRSLALVDSHEHNIIQAVDLVIGAIAHFKNAQVGGSEHKAALAEHVLNLCGLPNLSDDSPWGERKFSIWNFRFREATAPANGRR